MMMPPPWPFNGLFGLQRVFGCLGKKCFLSSIFLFLVFQFACFFFLFCPDTFNLRHLKFFLFVTQLLYVMYLFNCKRVNCDHLHPTELLFFCNYLFLRKAWNRNKDADVAIIHSNTSKVVNRLSVKYVQIYRRNVLLFSSPLEALALALAVALVLSLSLTLVTLIFVEMKKAVNLQEEERERERERYVKLSSNLSRCKRANPCVSENKRGSFPFKKKKKTEFRNALFSKNTTRSQIFFK